jgi:hypothetical protein
LNTPVMSGGVQPMTIGFCQRLPWAKAAVTERISSSRTLIPSDESPRFALLPQHLLSRDFAGHCGAA